MMVEDFRQRFMKRVGLYYAVLFGYLITTGMHIPDGYLSPVTCAVFFLLVLPFWVIGIRHIRETMSARNVPLIALMAAFSFVIMMFNVPLPGGTSGHAIGAALAAILLGPEVATIAVSIALIIQAFFFGDGGILAIGANVFNMAVIVPYVAYAIYQFFSRNQPIQSKRRLVGSFLGGWSGLTLGALFAGIEFGIQPLLFKAADGTPLYAPYPLSIALPAMVIPHLLVAAVIEGMVTTLVLVYLQRSNPAVLEMADKPGLASAASAASGPAKLGWLWIGLIALVIASPVGLLAPGTAWGEWGTHELSSLGLAFIPQGMAKLSTLWGAPLAGYDLPALGNVNLGYILSASVGMLVVIVLVWLFGVLLTRRPAKTVKE
jgi:cobalt/nickel transport system permease protein